jgi:hypothetical protein
MNHTNFSGRPVQVLRVQPCVVLDLLWNVESRGLSIPAEYRGRKDLEGARVLYCRMVDGLIWLYLEKEGWPIILTGDVPTERHYLLQSKEGIFATAEVQKSVPCQMAVL